MTEGREVWHRDGSGRVGRRTKLEPREWAHVQTFPIAGTLTRPMYPIAPRSWTATHRSCELVPLSGRSLDHPDSMSVPPSPAPDGHARPRAAMPALRVVEPGAPSVRFTFDGRSVEAGSGETIAVALLAAGQKALRTTSRRGEPRGVFCNMGVCFECLVEVDGRPNQRACQTVVRSGMSVCTQHGMGSPPSGAEPDS